MKPSDVESNIQNLGDAWEQFKHVNNARLAAPEGSNQTPAKEGKMKPIDEIIAELEALDKARTQGDYRVETFAIANPKHGSVGIFKDKKYSGHLTNDIPINDTKFIAAAPTMMQVIRELKAKCDEQERLLGLATREFQALMDKARLEQRCVMEIENKVRDYATNQLHVIFYRCKETLTQLQARDK